MEVRKIFTEQANKKARNTNNVICKGCGEIITSEMCYEVDGLKGYAVDGKCLHFCIPCTRRKEYHESDRRENITGTLNYTWIRKGDFSLEIESIKVGQVYKIKVCDSDPKEDMYTIPDYFATIYEATLISEPEYKEDEKMVIFVNRETYDVEYVEREKIILESVCFPTNTPIKTYPTTAKAVSIFFFIPTSSIRPRLNIRIRYLIS